MRPQPASRAHGPRLTRALSLALAGVAAAWAAAWLAPLGWPFELFVHFRVQNGVAAGVLAAVLLALRQPMPAALGAVLAAIQLWPTGSPAHAAAGACSGDEVRVVTANLSYRNSDPRRFIDWLKREPADLVLLQELTPAWASALERLPEYPQRRFVVREDAYGLGVLSRWPTEGLVARDLAGDGLPSFVGPMDVGGTHFTLAVLHSRWPLLPQLMRYRDRALTRLADEVRQQSGPWVVGGDFNTTPDSPVFQRLLETSGLRETGSQGAWAPTWRADFWPLALRIDHVLTSPELCVIASGTGPDIGSDHRPVRVRLQWPGA
jgi:endonuclease/exonuclease/phosphatase (EEP) superfamily protein YafD